MGLFDGIIGQVAGQLGSQLGGENASIANSLWEYVQNQEGGIAGLVERLRSGGLGAEVASWLGDGDNLPVSAAQLSEALGSGFLGELATRAGVSQEQIATALTSLLPALVDQLSAGGELRPGGDLMAQAGSLFGGLFGNRG